MLIQTHNIIIILWLYVYTGLMEAVSEELF